jgi:hypothetical protein
VVVSLEGGAAISLLFLFFAPPLANVSKITINIGLSDYATTPAFSAREFRFSVLPFKLASGPNIANE